MHIEETFGSVFVVDRKRFGVLWIAIPAYAKSNLACRFAKIHTQAKKLNGDHRTKRCKDESELHLEMEIKRRQNRCINLLQRENDVRRSLHFGSSPFYDALSVGGRPDDVVLAASIRAAVDFWIRRRNGRSRCRWLHG